jgi:isoamyl acetate esterase
MKILPKGIWLVLLFILTIAMTNSKPRKVLFFGDSITQMGIQPNGYISKMGEALQKKSLADQYELIGSGIGGNKIYDLYLRMDDDVLAKNPDLVFIWIGVNDVWHKKSFGTGTDPDKFEKFYVAIIRKLQARNIKIILCTPAAIGEKKDLGNPQDEDLNQYAEIIRKVAEKNNCGLLDLRKIFLDYDLKNNPDNKESGILTVDRVHLNETGNQLVADKMMEMLLQ